LVLSFCAVSLHIVRMVRKLFFSMFMYAFEILPLVLYSLKNPSWWTQIWYADDTSTTVTVDNLYVWFTLLYDLGWSMRLNHLLNRYRVNGGRPCIPKIDNMRNDVIMYVCLLVHKRMWFLTFEGLPTTFEGLKMFITT